MTVLLAFPGRADVLRPRPATPEFDAASGGDAFRPLLRWRSVARVQGQ